MTATKTVCDVSQEAKPSRAEPLKTLASKGVLRLLRHFKHTVNVYAYARETKPTTHDDEKLFPVAVSANRGNRITT